MFSWALLNTLLLSIVLSFSYVYWFFKKSHKFFDQCGIPYAKPHWFFGNKKDVVLRRKPPWIGYKETYDEFKSHRFFGVYTLHKPSVVICDPELIKKILVKDFAFFHDRDIAINKQIEPLANHVGNLSGDEWKNLRIKLTSAFSSGKMKMMFGLVKKCAEDIEPTLNKYFIDDEAFEAKDLFARFATDVIGSCAFGIDTHSLQDPDSEFRKMGKAIFQPSWQSFIRILFPNVPTPLIKLLGLEFFPKKIDSYFTNIVKDMVKHREENNITRGDFLDLLIAMKNHKQLEKLKDQNDDSDLTKFMAQIGEKYVKNDVEMTIEVIVAQCFLFFLGGFEGASSALSYLLFELAQNTEIQNRLRQEILTSLESNEGQFTYKMMRNMPYLDMVISEVLRKYSFAILISRKCTENYKIPNSDAIIKKGTDIIIPLMGLHHDTEYFEKPNHFYPEHFTKQAKLKRHNFAYLPFGEGPRVCIAERFAKMQIIVGAVHLLKSFHFELSPKTKIPLEHVIAGVALTVKGGIWMKCRPLK